MFSRIRGVETDKNTTIFDEDYEYYAHFALVNTDGGKVKAICSWGGFYDYYASQSSQEQEAFLRDLESKKIPAYSTCSHKANIDLKRSMG